MWKPKKQIEWAVKTSLNIVTDVSENMRDIYVNEHLSDNGMATIANMLNNIEDFTELMSSIDSELKDNIIIENQALKEENDMLKVQVRELKYTNDKLREQIERLFNGYKKDMKSMETFLNNMQNSIGECMNSQVEAVGTLMCRIDDKVNTIATTEYMKKDKTPRRGNKAPRYNDNIDNNDIKARYSNGERIQDIADVYGVSYITIQTRLKELGVELVDRRKERRKNKED